MKGQLPETGREVPRLELPEDVAALYAWANLSGARYRDFSASRREARAQLRQRSAQQNQDAETQAKEQAEAFAEESEHAARQAAEVARFHQAQVRRAVGEHRRTELEREQVARERALQYAGQMIRRAAEERAEVARRSLALQAAESAARRVDQEVAEAHASAERQAQQYLAAAIRPSVVAAPALAEYRETAVIDPYLSTRTAGHTMRRVRSTLAPEGDMRPERFPRRRDVRAMNPQAEQVLNPGLLYAEQSPALQDRTGSLFTITAQAQLSTGEPYRTLPSSPSSGAATGRRIPLANEPDPGFPLNEAGGAQIDAVSDFRGRKHAVQESFEGELPAWIHEPSGFDLNENARVASHAASPVADTLQHSREKVASRWFAMRGVFDPTAPDMEPIQASAREAGSPILAIFSLAGGVGKTSLAASLGRSLSAAGEKVLLADVTVQGILPFYFGATELRQGVVRTFSPPAGSADAPISLVSYDPLSRADTGHGSEDAVLEQLVKGRDSFGHLLVDLNPAASPLLRQLTHIDAMVLVPVAPDMTTVITLGAMEKFFEGMVDSSGRSVQPCYLLTQFDAALPLHLDVREGLRQKLGPRLLPFVIRRSPEVAEALAEGMTVIDYAPGSGVASDYQNLANWARTLVRPNQTHGRGARWSEQ